MRHLVATVALLAACAESSAPQVNASCELGECDLPATLSLAAKLVPPADSSLVACEFPPEEIGLVDGTLALDFKPASQLTVQVRDESRGDPVPSDVVLARASRITGQATVLASGTHTAEAPAEMRLLAGASYDVFATPLPPEDERYVRNVLRGVTPGATLDVQLPEPTDAIRGKFLIDEPTNVKVRLQGFRDGTDERTTVARVRPGDTFSLGAVLIEGDWRVQATVTFSDPNVPDNEVPLEGLEFVLDAAVGCEVDPQVSCTLSEGETDLEVPLPPLPEPHPRDVVVRAVDAAGVPTLVEGAEILFESEIPVPGAQRAVLTSRGLTGADGTDAVPLVEDLGVYHVTVIPPAHSGFASKRFEGVYVQAATGPMQFDLGLRPRVSGSVSAVRSPEGGMGVTGVTITAVPSPVQAEGLALPHSGAAFSTTTDDDGDFSLRVDPGYYDLEVTPPEGSELPRWSSDNVPILEDVAGLEIVLPEAIPIPVVVRSEGLPVSGATVRMLVINKDGGRAPRERAKAVTDELGEAVLVLPNP